MNCECPSDKAINNYTKSIYSLREAYFIFIIIFILSIVSVSIYIITNENVVYEPQWDYGLKIIAGILSLLLVYSIGYYYAYPKTNSTAIWPKLIIMAICGFLIAFGNASLGIDETVKTDRTDRTDSENIVTLSPLIKMDNDTVSVTTLLVGIIVLFLMFVEMGVGFL
jgi:hypothetical protein